MVVRRALLRKTQEKVPKLIAETGMRHYIAVSFIYVQKPVPLTESFDPLLESQIYELWPGIVSTGYRPAFDRPPSSSCSTATWLHHVEDTSSSKDATITETSPRGRPTCGPRRFSNQEEKERPHTICDAISDFLLYLFLYGSRCVSNIEATYAISVWYSSFSLEHVMKH